MTVIEIVAEDYTYYREISREDLHAAVTLWLAHRDHDEAFKVVWDRSKPFAIADTSVVEHGFINGPDLDVNEESWDELRASLEEE